MKSLKLVSLSILLSGIFFSCSKDEIETEYTAIPVSENVTSNFNSEITQKLIDIGFDPFETQKKEETLPDGTKIESYIYKDVSFPASVIEEIDNQSSNTGFEKQFRTNNLAAGNRTYTIAFFDFNQPFQRQAAGDAVYLFNNVLRTTVRLNIVFANGSDFGSTPKDIAVFFGNLLPFNNARADAPAFNLPGRNIRFNSVLLTIQGFNTRARLRNIIMHEIGHTFGLRHTDFGLTGEAVGEIGRRPIPGTDTSGFDVISIMASSNNRTNREGGYTDNDIRGMRTLYGFR